MKHSVTGGWARVSRRGWKSWLEDHGLDDAGIVERPTERQALRNLRVLSYLDPNGDLPLTPLEFDLWALDRQFMRDFQTQLFIMQYGRLTAGQKYAWIAARRPGLMPLQIRAILDDVAAVLQDYACADLILVLFDDKLAV